MKQTIYIDVLAAINLLVDYFLLYAAAQLTGRRRERVRMCLGACIGAAGSLVILLPALPWAVNLLMTAAISAAMTAVAFGVKNLRSFLWTLAALYALTMLYSGIMLLVWRVGGGDIMVNNGAVYINIDPRLLILTTIVMYAVLSLFSGRLRTRGLRRAQCTVTVYGNDKSVAVNGLIDTGNMLTEPFSGLPVIVARRRQVSRVVPEGLPEDVTDVYINDKSVSRAVRVIPYHTASDTGLLLAYCPPRIDIEVNGVLIKDVKAYLALISDDHSSLGDAVVNPDILE